MPSMAKPMSEHAGHLLVVDDEEANRDMLARRLKRRHFDVTMAADGAAALELVEQHNFDLILLDLMMPGISGLEVLKIVREQYSASQLPVIVITAQRGRESAIAAIEAGANDYISKPVDLAVLMARIQSQVDGAQAKALLDQANRNLELRVEQRTTELREVNESLTREIAEKIQAEETLLEVQSRTNAILNFTLNGIIVTDLDGRIEFINRSGEKMFGLSLSKALSLGIESIIENGRNIIREGKARSAKALAEGFNCEVVAIQPSGGSFPADLSLRRMTSDQGTSFLFVISDATQKLAADEEKKTLESQLRQSQKIESLGTLAGGIAHEFNNILMVVSGYIRRALGDESLSDETRENLDEAGDAAARAASITKKLLVFSGKHAQETGVIDVGELLTDAESMLVPLIGEQIKLVLEVTDDAHRINADADQLRQAVVNLVINASHALGGGGLIKLGTGCVDFDEDFKPTVGSMIAPGKYVSLFVEDEGCGMDEELIGKIFDPFFTTKGLGTGTGLGLAVIYGFVQESGGAIDVQSVVGEGTRFTLYFPLSDKQLTAAKITDERISKGDGELVMVVEDEDALRHLLVGDLESLGYEIVAAADGIEAIEIEADLEKPIELLLSDVRMPGFSGPETAAALSKTQPEMKIIFMSGYAPDDERGRTHVPKGSPFVSKPVDLATLANKMREALDG